MACDVQPTTAPRQRPPIRFVIPRLEVEINPPPPGHKIACANCPNAPGTPPPNPAVVRVLAGPAGIVPLCEKCAPQALQAIVEETVQALVRDFTD